MLVRQALKSFPIKSLYEFAKDKDAIVRTIAAQCLQLNKEAADKTFDFALQLTKSTNAEEREIAAYILGQLCPPDYPYKDRSLRVLEELAKDPVAMVRATAIASLGHLKSSTSRKLILESLCDPDSDVVYCAASALWAIGLSSTDKNLVQKMSRKFDKKTQKSIEVWIEGS